MPKIIGEEKLKERDHPLMEITRNGTLMPPINASFHFDRKWALKEKAGRW